MTESAKFTHHSPAGPSVVSTPLHYQDTPLFAIQISHISIPPGVSDRYANSEIDLTEYILASGFQNSDPLVSVPDCCRPWIDAGTVIQTRETTCVNRLDCLNTGG